MEKLEILIKRVEELKKSYHSVGFKSLTSQYLDRTGIISIGGEWVTNVGDFEGYGSTIEESLENLIVKMESYGEFKKALKKYKKDIKKVS